MSALGPNLTSKTPSTVNFSSSVSTKIETSVSVSKATTAFTTFDQTTPSSITHKPSTSSKLLNTTGVSLVATSTAPTTSSTNRTADASATSFPTSPSLIQNCEGAGTNGVYSIMIEQQLVYVYCEVQIEGNNWMVFQRRINGEVDFFLNWTDYVNGFGNASGEFWLGLQALHEITSNGSYRLRVDLEDWENNTAHVEYSSFSIGDSSSDYVLHVSGYPGNTGVGDSLAHYNGQPFSTKDRDNDQLSDNCTVTAHGAWWYHGCYNSNLNGKYRNVGPGDANGVEWYHWKVSHYSVKRASMKIRPN